MPDLEPALNFERAGHLRKDLDFLEAQLRAPGTLLLPVWRSLTLVSEHKLVLRPLSAAEALLSGDGELVWLGRVGDTSCFAIDISGLDDPLSHRALHGTGDFQDLRQIGNSLPRADAELAAYARGLMYWHTRHLFCGVCGGRTVAREGGHVRKCRNDTCGVLHFPRTDPAIIVLVHHGDACLLGHHRRGPKGMYTTLAGFVEPGETLEAAVAREVQEESGVVLDQVHYFRSQPWPFPASLMLGFVAEAVSREIHVDEDELLDARWFTRDEIRRREALGFFIPGTYSVAGQLIGAFVDGTHLRTSP